MPFPRSHHPVPPPVGERAVGGAGEVRLGLRSRIALSVALVSFVLSTAVSLSVFTVARETLINAREQSSAERALRNAAQFANRDISEAGAAVLQTQLSSLSEAGKPMIAWNGGAESTTLDSQYTVDELPSELRREALQGSEPSIMRYESEGRALVAVAVPIPDQNAAFFEVSLLDDIEEALHSILVALVAAVIGSTVAAGLLGYWASRYTIRPLTRVSLAAESVALGQLDTRLDYEAYAHDRDLAPLVANFNGMVQALQERINRDARFASDVSHELRSPLTTLNAGLGVLENNRDEMPERARQALDLLILDVNRFTQLVEDLLEISRFDAGAVRLELDDVALVPMVRSTVNSITHGRVPVESEPAVEHLVIACDRRRLARILANFLTNADKYADGATHVSVELHEPDPDDLDGEPSVRIAVEDAGPGVPDDQRSSVFHRFNRGDQGGSRGSDVGVGLGLALAAEHARLQAGTVWVEDRSDGGQGARFVVELPALEVDDGPDEQEEEKDLSAATPESTSNLTLTGEHRAVVITDGRDPR